MSTHSIDESTIPGQTPSSELTSSAWRGALIGLVPLAPDVSQPKRTRQQVTTEFPVFHVKWATSATYWTTLRYFLTTSLRGSKPHPRSAGVDLA